MIEDDCDNKLDNPIIKSNDTISSLYAGLTAGALCTIVCAPLDTIKVRTQAQGALNLKDHQKYNGIFNSLKKISNEEGFRGLYRGLGPGLCTVPLFHGIYFSSYSHFKERLAQDYPNIPTSIQHLLSAITAGAIGDIITNPFWVTRTRIQTLSLHHMLKNNGKYINISAIDMFIKIYKEEGFKSFYKGLSASLLGLSHVAVQFPLYEYLKKDFRKRRNGPETAPDLIICSITAKLVASGMTYPHEVLRVRLQDSAASKLGLIKTLKSIIKNEGLFALWTGFSINISRAFPATITTFLTFEYVFRFLKIYHS